MSYATAQRAAGLLTIAPAGTTCRGNTPYSGSNFACGGNQGSPADAVHTWEGKHYCAYHSPFDVTEADRIALKARDAAPTATSEELLDDEEFNQILELEVQTASEKTAVVYGADLATRVRAQRNLKKVQGRLHAAINALSLDRLQAYGEYRKLAR